MSPTARSLKYLRQLGYYAEVVERWVSRLNVRRDFLHCIDILAFKPGAPVIGIQATSAGNVSSRLNKAKARLELALWLRAGCSFEVWGWKQIGERWHVRRVEIKADDMAAVEVQALPRRRRLRKGEQQALLFPD
jgi:hypothetical protein